MAVRSKPPLAADYEAVGHFDAFGHTGSRHLVEHRSTATLAFLEPDEQDGSGAVLPQRRHHRGHGVAHMLGWRQVDALDQADPGAAQAHGHEAVPG